MFGFINFSFFAIRLWKTEELDGAVSSVDSIVMAFFFMQYFLPLSLFCLLHFLWHFTGEIFLLCAWLFALCGSWHWKTCFVWLGCFLLLGVFCYLSTRSSAFLAFFFYCFLFEDFFFSFCFSLHILVDSPLSWCSIAVNTAMNRVCNVSQFRSNPTWLVGVAHVQNGFYVTKNF